ncbi:MAG: hypothetical protein HY594_01285 [Candidatus Omnitrophica bacterium]|nr:hypothetical protein [Candidatus Omnitrophota bacterium]
MKLPGWGWWNKRWVHLLATAVLAVYLGLRALIFWNGVQIRRVQGQLDEMRPQVVQSVQAKERQSLLKAHQQFIDVLRASTVDWQDKMQKIAERLPPSLMLTGMTLQESRVILQGILRHPPPEPQAHLAGIANALKREGVFEEVIVAVKPIEPDDPSIVRVELTGEF